MTTIDHRPDAVTSAIADVADDAGRALTGVVGWVTTADHKRVGRAFIVSSLMMGIAALVVGVLLGVERIDANNTVLRADSIDQLFSLHRVGVSFLVVLPLLLGLSLAVAPLQVGSRSATFPRAAALGFWAWLSGSVMVVVAYVGNGGPGGGDAKMVDLFLMGLAMALIGVLATAGSLVVTVLTSRAPGMRLDRTPMVAWSALVGGVALVLTLPVLVGDLILLSVDHHYARVAFGGNKDILTWMGWALGTPATLVLVIPALGMVADILITASGRRHPMRGGLLFGIGVAATAALGAVMQKPNLLPWSGSSGSDRIKNLLPYAFFNLLPILGVVVTIGLGVLALKAGKPRFSAALVFGLLGGLSILAGVLASALTPILDLQLVGTTYEEGVFVMIAYGAVLAGLGGVAHWGPKLWGRKIADKQLAPLALLGALGVDLAAIPLMVAGFQGQPAMAAGGYDYKLSPQLLNVLGAIGEAAVLATVLFFGLLALRSFTKGEAAGDDPWDGQTLEWATSSPPPADNFADLAMVSSATPLLDLKPARSDA